MSALTPLASTASSASPIAPTDEDIVTRVLDGDATSFEILMRRYNALVFRTARSVVRSDAAAEDCAQQAWVLAFDKLEQLTERAGFSAWVSRIAYRQALRMARFDRSRGLVPLDALESPMLALSSTPEHDAHRGQLRAQLEASIDALPSTLREPFVLCEVHNLSARETGALLGLSEQNVRVRAHRARAALRETLGEFMSPELAFAFDGARCNRMVHEVMRVVRSRA